jgi:glucokinase
MSIVLLNKDLAIPLYHQLKCALMEAFEKGQWQSGQQLPNETQLAKNFGVSKITVRKALQELAELGYVRRQQGRGTFVSKVNQALAIDLSATKTAIAVVDGDGRISNKQEMPAAASFEGTVEQIAARLDAPVAAVGVTVPGIYEASSGTAWAPNLWGRDFHPLRDALAERSPALLAIGSNRTGSVLAEQWLGSARGLSDVVFVVVGTGIGVGIVAGGRPIEGAHGIAGAAGWMVVGGPWRPEYMERGGWESEAAGPAVARRAGMENAEVVMAAARGGDRKALEVLDETADSLALGIAGLISILDPQMVVLGGGLMQASDLMLERIRRQALAWTQPVSATHVRIEKTALGEDAGLLGAARLAWLAIGDRGPGAGGRGPGEGCGLPPRFRLGGSVMSAGIYYRQISGVLAAIHESQKAKLEDAGKILASAIAIGNRVFLFGSGHSVIPVMDIFPRYGSPCIFNRFCTGMRGYNACCTRETESIS